ncbi:MAG: hypothetical protein KBT03_11105 [Bacteroidales bacterium]|nr:hypothetical protein [Candidatus Scybalousia scybalohippi]
MNYVVNKKAYPHWCRIYHVESDGASKSVQFSTPSERIEKVIYEGKCHKYGSSQMRKFTNQNVVKADFAVDIPHVVHGIHPGYLIDVEDGISSYTGVEIVVPFPDDISNLGTTVFFNVTMN